MKMNGKELNCFHSFHLTNFEFKFPHLFILLVCFVLVEQKLYVGFGRAFCLCVLPVLLHLCNFFLYSLNYKVYKFFICPHDARTCVRFCSFLLSLIHFIVLLFFLLICQPINHQRHSFTHPNLKCYKLTCVIFIQPNIQIDLAFQ